MNNTILPTKEVELVKKAISVVKELTYVHSHTDVEDLAIASSSQFGRVKVLLYLDFVKDFVNNAIALEKLLDITEEEFKKDLEEIGTTLEEFEKNLLTKAVLELLSTN